VEDEKLPITDHLSELRSRLIKSLLAIAAGFALSYGFSKAIFDFLTKPLVKALPPGSHLIYTALPEAFLTYIKVSFFSGLVLATPVIFYQVWKFVMPGLYANERRHVGPFVLAATFFFLLGASFAYFVVFPFGFKFLLGYASGDIYAMPKLNEYLSFIVTLLIAFGSIFELPVVIFFLAKIGIVSPQFLRKQRRYAILAIAVVAAVLTPPDPLSMMFMMIPLLILYEFSVWVASLVWKTKSAAPSAEEAGNQ
jgi:sec-independent protein translocase protein TatC